MINQITIMGPQGSGKGTQAQLLSKKLKIPALSMGDVIRAEIEKKTKIGKQIKPYVKKGELVPFGLNNQLLVQRLNEKDLQDGFILDGYPRNLEQAEFLDKIVNLTHAINIEISDKEAIGRLGGRRTCKKCATVYHIRYKPPKKEGVCDDCGSELYIREDDYPKAIRQRLRIYHKETEPVLKHYQKKGVLYKIDGEKNIKDVHEYVIKIFNF
jgi:adenylate kinase